MGYIDFTMTELASALRSRQSVEFDGNFIVDGPRGNGKSTFIWKLFKEMGNFHPREDIVFSREDVMKCIKRKYSLIMADEMINSAHNRDFFGSEQKQLIKMLNMYRDNFNILGGAVPFFYDLDTQVRKFIKMRITVLSRGVAVVQFARPSLYSNDPWETKQNQKIEMGWVNKQKAGHKVKANYHRLTTFKGYIHYGPLTKKDEELYKKIKEEKRTQLMGEADEKNEKADRYEALYTRLKEGNLSKRDFDMACMLLGKHRNTITEQLRQRLLRDGRVAQVAPLLT